MTIDTKAVEHESRIATRMASGLLWGQVLRTVEVGASLLFLIFVVRKLGPSQYGVYGQIINICALSALITSLGFSEALSKYLPKVAAEKSPAAAVSLARRIIGLNMLLVAGFCVILWISRFAIANRLHCTQTIPYWPLVLTLFAGQSLSSTLAMANVGLMKISRVCFVGSTMNILALCGAIVGLSAYGPTARIAIFASAAAFIIGTLTYFFASRDWLFQSSAETVDMKPVWRFSSNAWLVKMATFAMSGEIMVFLMGLWLDDSKQIGYFNSAYMPLRKLQVLLLGWTLPVLPSLSELLATRGPKSISMAYRLYTKILIGLVVPVCGFVILNGKPIVSILFGKSFLPAVPSLQIYSGFWLVSSIFGSGLATFVLYSMDKAKTALLIRLVVAALTFVLAYILIFAFKSLGAIIAAGLAMMATAAWEIGIIRKLLSIDSPMLYTGKVLLASGIALGLTFFLSPASLWKLMLSSILFTALYALILIRFKPLEADEKNILLKHPRLGSLLAMLGE